MGPVKRAWKRICLSLLAALCMACCGDPGVPAENGDGGEETWVKYVNNPVLSPDHESGDNYDHYNVSDCCVIKDGTTYKMWYTCGGFTPANPSNHCSIAYATSADGIAWLRHDGNPVLDNDETAWDKYAVETVSVLMDPGAVDSERYKMWYAGRTKTYENGGPAYDIGYATSPDGIVWSKYAGNPVVRRGSSGDWDDYFIEGPSVIKDGDTYKMWYAGFDSTADGHDTDGKVSIGYATSTDGVRWTKYAGNPVIVVGAAGSWDCKTVQDPQVILLGGVYHMWYSGANSDFSNYGQQTGYAYSDDGITWIKSSKNPVLKRGGAGEWDANTAGFGSVIIDGDMARMWYTGKDQDDPSRFPYYWDIGYAERAW